MRNRVVKSRRRSRGEGEGEGSYNVNLDLQGRDDAVDSRFKTCGPSVKGHDGVFDLLSHLGRDRLLGTQRRIFQLVEDAQQKAGCLSVHTESPAGAVCATEQTIQRVGEIGASLPPLLVRVEPAEEVGLGVVVEAHVRLDAVRVGVELLLRELADGGELVLQQDDRQQQRVRPERHGVVQPVSDAGVELPRLILSPRVLVDRVDAFDKGRGSPR